jgi:hypothetical protein
MGICESDELLLPEPIVIPCVEPKQIPYRKDEIVLRVVNGKMEGFTFLDKNLIPCYRIPHFRETICYRVLLKPMESEKPKIMYHESKLTIYCNVRTPILFMNDDISKVYSSQSNVKVKQRGCSRYLDTYTYKWGTRVGFANVIIISTMDNPSFTVEDLFQLHKPHCLILILDYPESIFLSFSNKK